MRPTKRYPRKAQPQFWLSSVMGYLFVFTFSFFFVLEQAPTLQHNSGEQPDIYGDSVSVITASFAVADHHPFHLPESDTTLPEPEIPDESESTDNWDDEAGKLFYNVANTNLDLHAKECVASQLQLSIESRPTIALFILYHSWKSFLS